ncbi:MAG: transporter substrate-binding domain-containing protein [Acidobacteriota bacterium]
MLVATALPGHIARGEAPDPVASDLAEVRRSGHLTMLCWPHQESRFVRRMVAEYGEEGLHRFAGIDVEILRGFAESLGVRLEVKPMPQSFSELLPSLLRGDGQVIASSWTITEARASQVDFSRPYHSVEKLVLARRTSQLASVADFVGLTAAVVAGSSHEEHLLALGTESLRIEQTEFTFQNYAEVAEGRADFTVVDSGAVQKVLEENVEFANLTTAFVFPREDEYGFAVAPGSDLLAPLNAYLQEIEKSGELERIKARHLQAAD